MRSLKTGLAAACLGLEGAAGALDVDDPKALPLHFALESLSAEAATAAGAGMGRAAYYNVRAPNGDATLRTTAKLTLAGSEGCDLCVGLDGMVFSAVPELTTTGPGAGNGLSLADMVRGGAGEAFVVYRLQAGR